MISILYGSFGAATGIAQGLFRGVLRAVPLPAAAQTEAGVKHFTTELVADCAGRDPSTAPRSVSLLPLLIVGHARVGKTTLVNTFLHGQYLEAPEPTLGADLSVKHLSNQQVSLQIWDTAGEAQADLLDSHFWSNAAGAVIVCNLHQPDCTHCLNFWEQKMHQEAYGLPIVVVTVRHGYNKLLKPEVAEQEEQLVAQWCRDKDVAQFHIDDPCNQPAAEEAFTTLIDRAVLYSEQKAKPMNRTISTEAYPSLFLMQNGHAVDLDKLLK